MASKRIVNNNNYIEIIISNNKQTKKIKQNDIFNEILKSIDNLTINDFEVDLKCSIPRFILYKDKEYIYKSNFEIIEKNIIKLYNDKVIQYAGYQ
jgi:hypothetical protein